MFVMRCSGRERLAVFGGPHPGVLSICCVGGGGAVLAVSAVGGS